jgi:hypothetical protein
MTSRIFSWPGNPSPAPWSGSFDDIAAASREFDEGCRPQEEHQAKGNKGKAAKLNVDASEGKRKQ